MITDKDSGVVRLDDVRLSYVNLSTPPRPPKGTPKGTPGTKYTVAIILDKRKHAKQIEEIKTVRDHIAALQWPNGKPAGVKFCLRDGIERKKEDSDDEYAEGYGPDTMFFNASSETKRGAIPCVYQDPRKPILNADIDRVLHSGCYANVLVRFWVQNNEFGKRINAEIKTVQFCRSGDPLGGGTPVDPTKAFDVVEDASGAQVSEADSAWD